MSGPALFGAAHLAWMAGIVLAAAGAVVVCRRGLVPQRALRGLLVCLLAGCELQRYVHDGLSWPNGLPLQSCSITAWIAVAACLTLSPLAGEYVYFTGLAGAGIAVITPDMGAQWPPRFFLTHGVLIATAAVLAFGNLVPLRPWAVWRAWGLFAANAVLIAAFDLASGANYWYLRGKPGSVTVYNWMGPWPVYIFSAGLFGLGLFGLLWLAWKRSARSTGSSLFSAQRLERPAAQQSVRG